MSTSVLRQLRCHAPRIMSSIHPNAHNNLRRWFLATHSHKLVFTHPRNAFAARPPAQPTELVFSPSQKYLEQEEIDVEPLPPEQVRINITDRAAEQLRTISSREQNPDAAVRITVESGGCHGYQYRMELATNRCPDDYHFSHPTIKPSNVLIDAISMSLINGSTIDFATELIGSSFRVLDNPHAKGSGCGCGISWELKV